MRLKLFAFLLPALALPFAGCGGGNGPAGFGSACTGGAALCVTSCNLGCSVANGCAVSEIAVNQALIFEFSQPIDPASVTSSSFRLRTSQGAEPLGNLLVQGNRIEFIPSVLVREGRNVYGFESDATYTLELGGSGSLAPIRAVGGGMLAGSIKCDLTANLGVVDFDGKAPESTLSIPQDPSLSIAPDTLIVLEFSEVIDTSTFTNGGTGGGIFYQVALPATSDPSKCSPTEFPLPGSVSLSVVRKENNSRVTRVLFRPSLLLPSESCVRVRVTPGIRDLSGKGAVAAEYLFRVEKRPIEDQFIREDFASAAKRDAEFSGAAWGGGSLTSGKLGGSGILGVFNAASGRDTNTKDSKGRNIYEWDTTNLTINGNLTLDGKDKTITNGVFEFQQFVIKENERVRFIGDAMPKIISAGLMQIDGAIEMPVPAPPTSNIDARRGILGGKGGVGGGTGGQGGDSPVFTAGQIDGRNGGTVVLPTGHPRASQAAGTGGIGSKAHPASGKSTDIVWIIDTGAKIFVPMTAAGGGGGSFWDTGNGSLLGTGGKAEHTIAKRPFWPFNPGEMGPPSKGGVAFPVLPGVSTKKSAEMFLIGGSGGGGAGAHPLYTADVNDIKWSPGAGGAGGGAVIHLQCGGDFVVGDKAEVLVRGGNSNNQPNNNTLPPVHAAGGAGSGGSVLIQVGGVPQISGEINVLGGAGGQLFEKTLLYVSSIGGNGGAGYLRVEADPIPSHTSFSSVKPTATAGNVGLLRPIDYDKVTIAQSKWYATQSLFPPQYLFYEIRAKIEGRDVVFSDDQTRFPGSVPAINGQPVRLLFQSASVDAATGDATNTPTPWIDGNDIEVLNEKRFDANTGNGLRFLIILDKNDTPSGDGSIEILSFNAGYRG